ncbi:MAG: DUF4860 domain-containing protein [Actinobacteria bacterium]|nr:DUF4860 domain-containing protein [Actinomycetota bacterium]
MGRQNDMDDARSSLAYVSARVKAQDGFDSYDSCPGPEGSALVLREEIDDVAYETRIYLYAGYLVEEYALASRQLSPDTAQIIAPTDTFVFSFEDDMLCISVDQGTQYVTWRSVQEGVAS